MATLTVTAKRRSERISRDALAFTARGSRFGWPDAGGDFTDSVIACEGSGLGADAFILFGGQAVKLLEGQGAIARLLS